jgi:chemotaxis protein CheC
MKIDVPTLGTFYEMAREGAGIAAGRLTKMTGVPTRVGVTRMNFMELSELRAELDDDTSSVGTAIELSGGFEGDSLLVFDEDSARTIARELVADVPDDGVDNIARSALLEVGQVTTNGFVDGWADILGTSIDASTPTYLTGTDPAPFIGALGASEGDLALLFRSRIETVGADVDVDQYVVPTRETVDALLERSSEGGTGIEFDKLAGFNRMAERGSTEMANSLETMTGLSMDAEIRRINFLSLDTIADEIPNERLVSVAFRFRGTPSGYLLFVFDEPSARTLMEAALPGSTSEGSFGAMERDAISEFGNVMASGFLDGWANVLETSIEHTTPRYTHDLGASVVDPLIIGLSTDQEFAFVFDTLLSDAERQIDASVFAIPDEHSLETALAELDLDRIDDAPLTATFDLARAEAGDDEPAELATPEEVTDR